MMAKKAFQLGDTLAEVLGKVSDPDTEQITQIELPLIDPAVRMAQDARIYLEREELARIGEEPGKLTIYTTGSVEEYTQRARQVGLERIEAVHPYPALKL